VQIGVNLGDRFFWQDYYFLNSIHKIVPFGGNLARFGHFGFVGGSGVGFGLDFIMGHLLYRFNMQTGHPVIVFQQFYPLAFGLGIL